MKYALILIGILIFFLILEQRGDQPVKFFQELRAAKHVSVLSKYSPMTSADQVLTDKFFANINLGITNLIPEYPQLVNWEKSKIYKGDSIPERRLEYDGICHVEILVYTLGGLNLISQYPPSSQIHGTMLGKNLRVFMIFKTENSEIESLEQRIATIIRNAIIDATKK